MANPLLWVEALTRLSDWIAKKRKKKHEDKAMVPKSEDFTAHDIQPDIFLECFTDHKCPMGNFGKLTFRGFCCYTVEQPWLDNKPFISCIPAGIYNLRIRESKVVKDTCQRNNLPYTAGWEICDVPGRTYVMIHIANTKDGVTGCIGMGDRLGCIDGKWAVMNSAATFDAFMKALPAGNHRIKIRRIIS